jgi:hypothetical protein
LFISENEIIGQIACIYQITQQNKNIKMRVRYTGHTQKNGAV